MKRLLAVSVWLLLYSSTFGMEAWESNYTLLLQKYVKTSGVQYSVWKENSADVLALKEIINQIGASGPSSQEREAQLAYYINAYNALVLGGVLDRYPLRSVRDLAPFYGFFPEQHHRCRKEDEPLCAEEEAAHSEDSRTADSLLH